MYGRKVDSSKLDWTPIPFDGITIKVLDQDETHGGCTVLTRMEPGSSIPKHHHERSDETVYVLEGDFVEDGIEFGPGSFFVGNAGTTHGPHQTRRGCVLLTTFSADVDFQLD